MAVWAIENLATPQGLDASVEAATPDPRLLEMGGRLHLGLEPKSKDQRRERHGRLASRTSNLLNLLSFVSARLDTPQIVPSAVAPMSSAERTPTSSSFVPRAPQLKRETYSKEVQTVDIDEEPTGPSEADIRQRIQAEIQSAQTLRDKQLEEENNQIAKEIEDEIRGESE